MKGLLRNLVFTFVSLFIVTSLLADTAFAKKKKKEEKSSRKWYCLLKG
jgi:hypothetical protein